MSGALAPRPRRTRHRPLLAVALVTGATLSIACGGAPPSPMVVTPVRRPIEVHEASGIAFDALSFDTDGYVRVSAYVAAGSRDASAPGAAALAATLLADATSPRAHGVATFDAIEISTVVEAAALDETVAAMLHALATRRFDDPAYSRARTSLEARRSAAALDPLRAAESRVVADLLGVPEERVDPLGAGGSEIATREETEAFVAAHAVAARTIVVVAGDVSRDDVKRAIGSARTSLPAGAANTEEASRLATAPVATAAYGPRDLTVVAALLAEDASIERRIAGLRRSLDAELEADVSVASLPSREGRIVTVRATSTNDPFDVLARIGREIAIASRLDLPSDSADVDVVRASRATGFRFATRGQSNAGLGLAARVEVREPRSRPRDDADQRNAEMALTERARAALGRGIADAAPNVVGRIAPESAEVVVGEGAMVRAKRATRTADVGIAVRLERGIAPSDAGADHILARTLAHVCAGSEPLDFVVDAEGLTLFERSSPEALSRDVDRLLPCLLDRVPSDAAFDEALRDALDGLDARLFGDDVATLAEAANPELASILAPLGSRRSITRIDSAALRIALAEGRRAEHVRVAVVGDVAPARVVALVAPRVSALAGGALRASPAPSLPRDLVATHHRAPLPLLLAVARVHAPASDEDEARAVASVLDRRFAERGIRVLAVRSATFGDDLFACVLLDADEPRAELSDAIVRDALRDRAAIGEARRALRATTSLSSADPALAAAFLARDARRAQAGGSDVVTLPADAAESADVVLVVGRSQPLGEASFESLAADPAPGDDAGTPIEPRRAESLRAKVSSFGASARPRHALTPRRSACYPVGE